jgi:hypothetical protein
MTAKLLALQRLAPERRDQEAITITAILEVTITTVIEKIITITAGKIFFSSKIICQKPI